MIQEKDLACGVCSTIPELKKCTGLSLETLEFYSDAWNEYSLFMKESVHDYAISEWIANRATYCLTQWSRWSLVLERGRIKRDAKLLANAFSHMNKWKYDLLSDCEL